MTRFVESPGDFFRKAYISTRLGLSIAPLRTLVGQYLMDPRIRREVRYHDLMNDLLKLDIVRRVRRGNLKARQPFHLSVDFDVETGVIMLTSIALSRSGDIVVDRESRAKGGSAIVPTQLEEVLKRGLVKRFVWDHSAMSLEIVYAPVGQKSITVGIGTGGIHRFDALVQLARHHPAQMTAALMPILRGESLQPSADFAS